MIKSSGNVNLPTGTKTSLAIPAGVQIARRRWDLDGILSEIRVRKSFLYTFIHLRINGLGRSGNGRSINTRPLRVVMALSSPFGLATVLLGRDPVPEVEAVFICKRLAIIFLISFV
nr:hypothetical protein [Tanacetum cinerariifolium]